MKTEERKQIKVKSAKTTSSFWKNSSRFNSRVSWRALRKTNYLTWGKTSSWRWRRWRMKFLLRNHKNWVGNLVMPMLLFWLHLALKILSRQGQDDGRKWNMSLYLSLSYFLKRTKTSKFEIFIAFLSILIANRLLKNVCWPKRESENCDWKDQRWLFRQKYLFGSVCSLMMVELSWPMRKAEEMFLSQNLFSRH